MDYRSVATESFEGEKLTADRTALVTGAASGIGRAIARALAGSGVRVIVSDLSDSGREAAEEIGGDFLQADLASMDEAAALGERAIELRGGVDILVNNAGFQKMAAVEDYDDRLWARFLQVMLVAPFQLTKRLLPGMKERQWGRIINISSIHGLVASPYKSAYISAKHGLIGLTKTVALEAGTHGVTVNAICPGFVRTPLVEGQIASQAAANGIPEDEVVEKIMMEPAAIKRLIEPEEVASLALFLASDDARSVTGSAYSIDAGWTAR